MNCTLVLMALLCVLSGCKGDEQKIVSLLQCTDCHTEHQDANHQQSCVSCHKGVTPAEDRDSAHLGYVPDPAHPDHLAENCAPCHGEITGQIKNSLHFTLAKSTNLFRKAFGGRIALSSFLETPKSNAPESPLQLADDLLRRRCFRCHPYSSGDPYPAVRHGTGCAACHMAFTDGKAASHDLQQPGDAQCLSCHYGNYVGFDYYGRFEHDFNYEYRTPFTISDTSFRPYGVEYHQLQPDIHQVRGMLCIDCHSGRELMQTGAEKPSCAACHSSESLQHSLPALVENRQGTFILHGRNGKDHTIPLMHNSAHRQQRDKMSCQVCHAQWVFNDFGKHYLRSDTEDFGPWANLSVQGDFEIETILKNNNDFDKTELPPIMTDKITGEPSVGLWYKGYTMRRWETPLLGRDDNDRITTMRPILDCFLSWIDAEEEVRFDSTPSGAANKGLRPYVPHTTGPAGLFYRERIEQFLAKEASTAK